MSYTASAYEAAVCPRPAKSKLLPAGPFYSFDGCAGRCFRCQVRCLQPAGLYQWPRCLGAAPATLPAFIVEGSGVVSLSAIPPTISAAVASTWRPPREAPLGQSVTCHLSVGLSSLRYPRVRLQCCLSQLSRKEKVKLSRLAATMNVALRPSHFVGPPMLSRQDWPRFEYSATCWPASFCVSGSLTPAWPRMRLVQRALRGLDSINAFEIGNCS